MDNNLLRTVLAVVLSIIVIIFYQSYFMPTPKTPPIKEAPESEKALTTPKPITEKYEEVIVEESLQGIQTKSESIPLQEQFIHVETSLYKAVFTTKGGSIVSWELKNHLDKEKNPVNLLNLPGDIPPFGIILEGSNPDSLINVNYEPSKEKIALSRERPSETLTMLYHQGNIAIKKTFTFFWDMYKVNFTIETEGLPPYFLTLGTNFGIYEPSGRSHYGPVLLRFSDREKFTSADMNKEEYFEPPVAWIAQEDKYFGVGLAPLTQSGRAKVWGDGKEANIAYEMKSGTSDFVFYAGPKEYERLKALDVKLEHLVYFGWSWIQPVARPLFFLLKLFYKYLQNYGLAIIVLTIIVRIPFFPLINKGQQSMKKLAALQPKMKEIQEKYKNNPQKMSAELKAFYTTHKVNPVGGCLPMLLQVPIFIALYNVLNIAVELRNAPFYFWITDLSQKDPYYILPIIMGVSMFIQQRMTPTTVDPTQAKIMMFLPVIFTFLFINFPSGLVLYWLVNNIIAIGQQYFINKRTA